MEIFGFWRPGPATKMFREQASLFPKRLEKLFFVSFASYKHLDERILVKKVGSGSVFYTIHKKSTAKKFVFAKGLITKNCAR